MISQINQGLPIPHIQKTRMRYRGPIESIKINNFQKDLHKDIIKLNEDISVGRNSLLQYFNEILDGSSQKIVISSDGKEVYTCEDNVPIHEMLSDNMVREEFLEDSNTTIWDL